MKLMNATNNAEASEMRERFLELLREQVGQGIYVWGGNGEILDDPDHLIEWVEKHETSGENLRRVIRMYLKRCESGVREIRAFDCSGLVYWALHDLDLLNTDVSSRGLYALCRPIQKSELRPGDLVFHHDGKQIVHVGVCDGDAEIECRGRDYGVVRNRRPKGYWNRFGRYPAFEVSEIAYVTVRGGSVRVRAGGSTKDRCVGIAHRGNRYLLLGRADSGWYKILWSGKEAYITDKPQYTEVQYG